MTTHQQKIFVISEGKVTEPSYLNILMSLREDFRIEIVMSGNNNARKINQKIAEIQKEVGLYSEIWVMIDKDDRSEFQLSEFHKMEKAKGNARIAISNPCFEVWLLNHYENAGDICEGRTGKAAKTICESRLKSIDGWGNYKKKVEVGLIMESNVLNAVKRAKKYESSRRRRWPPEVGATTFYKFIESYVDLDP